MFRLIEMKTMMVDSHQAFVVVVVSLIVPGKDGSDLAQQASEQSEMP